MQPWRWKGIELADIFCPEERFQILGIFAERRQLLPFEILMLKDEIPNAQPHLDFFEDIGFLERMSDGTYILRLEDAFVRAVKDLFDI
ncbi:MAG: hypothetical protein HWN65_05520 [Candidatus Helarchaeota archaeon]|nr:hypothetical protein [Candidatus Helarchaeota archaeon]